MQADLPEFIRKVKALGFKIKLDTNGTNPEMLEKILAEGLVDYLAMDLKAAPDDYARATGVKFDFDKIIRSVKLIRESGLPYEFRTTCVPGFIDETAMEAMGEFIAGADRWYLQNFKSDTGLIDQALKGRPGFSSIEMEKFASIGRKFVKKCEVRG